MLKEVLYLKLKGQRLGGDRKCNFSNNTGGTKSTMAIGNFNLRRSQVRKTSKIGLNQFLTFRHHASSI